MAGGPLACHRHVPAVRLHVKATGWRAADVPKARAGGPFSRRSQLPAGRFVVEVTAWRAASVSKARDGVPFSRRNLRAVDPFRGKNTEQQCTLKVKLMPGDRFLVETNGRRPTYVSQARAGEPFSCQCQRTVASLLSNPMASNSFSRRRHGLEAFSRQNQWLWDAVMPNPWSPAPLPR